MGRLLESITPSTMARVLSKLGFYSCLFMLLFGGGSLLSGKVSNIYSVRMYTLNTEHRTVV